MEFTRELYWNVGHGFMTLVPMYVFACIAVGILIYGFLQRVKIYKQGLPLDRSDQPGIRAGQLIRNILFQTHIIKKPWPGFIHGLFFWGFGLLTIGTSLVFLQADFTAPLFGIEFLHGTFYLIFSLTMDIAGGICLVMLIGLLVRRYFFVDDKVKPNSADGLMYALLAIILVSGFVVEGARIAVTEMSTSLAYWSPIGLICAKMLTGFGEGAILAMHKVLWWFHLLFVVAFIALVPLTRFKHLFTTAGNYFFAPLGPKGRLAKIDLEDEDAETFGATHLQELTWKDILDTDACTQCMRCQDICPAFNTGKPLSPMQVINTLGDVAINDPDKSLIEAVGEDALWACTTCGGCQSVCPATIEHVSKIAECRRAMVLMHAEFPEELQDTFNSLENQSNPWGFPEDTRADWCKDIDVPLMTDKPDADILWFVGCAGSFDDRGMVTSKAMASILNKAGVSYAILGTEERCNGDMARRCGNEYLAQMMIAENVETFNKYNPKRILTSCPHCFNTIKNEYPDFGATYDVVSHVDFIQELLETGKLNITKPLDQAITYHDSCYLGRWNNIYDSPRKVLSAVSGKGELVEMENCKDEAMCCGAGGGRMFMEETIGDRINNVRTQEAIKTGADTVSAACPFCLTMLSDGMRDNNGELEVKEIAVLVDQVTE